LNPVVHDAITMVVPSGKSSVGLSPNGVFGAFIDFDWWSAQIQTLNGNLGYIDPTHLALYLTKDVLLSPAHGVCCFTGYHGAAKSRNGNGDQPVQTFAYASYLLPGGADRPNGGTDWAHQDINTTTHEISEWANDPFINNYVEPTLSVATLPQYTSCNNILETGDPVDGMGFAMGTNVYFQGPNPDGTQSADGYYHPQDEALFPWFLRLAPNTISEPTQSPSTNIGRYSFMGNLNQFVEFQQPSTGCN
jgi:hypothetical protein